MSEHVADIEWVRGSAGFGRDYNRSHVWRFDSGVEVPASSAPGLRGDPTRVDPEEAFVASISSCHMLWFLHLAGDAGFVVNRYADHAVGKMITDPTGVTWISEVDLHPTISWEDPPPPQSMVTELHHHSHRECFIANSVRTAITVRS